MKKLIHYTAIALFAAATATVEAKDKHHDRDDDRDNRDRNEHRDDRNSHSRYRTQDQTRTIYIIENGRPVARTVFVDPSGHYYHRDAGQPTYIRDHYYDSYPSRYYTSSGKRRLFIRLPF